MRSIAAFVLIFSLSAYAQLATQEATPIVIQAKRSAASSLAFDVNVVSGHELMVGYQCFSGGSCAAGPSIADTLTTTWTSRVTQGSTQCGNAWIWTGQASSSGADTITITNGGSFQGLVISEFANVSNTLDVASQAVGWTSLQTVTTPSITTTSNGSLLFALGHTCNSGQFGAVYPLFPLTDDSTADSTASGWKVLGAAGSGNTVQFKRTSAGSSGNTAVVAMKANTSLTVVTTKIPDAVSGTAYSFDLHANGGSGSYTWALTSGSLPAGLSLSSGGTISGTPTAGNGDASLTFQVTDGVSATATKALVVHVGTSFNTVALIQNIAPSCGGSIGSPTSGDLILITGSGAGGGIPKFQDTLGTTYSHLPLSFENYSTADGHGQTNFLAWGFAASTGAANLTCSAGGSGVIITNLILHEFSNIQKTFDPTVLVGTLASTASPYTSGSITVPVSETLFSWVNPYTSTATITTQAPYTAGKTNTTSGQQLTAEYQIGASSGSTTASYAATSNTDGNWAIGLTAFRPTSSGTAPQPVTDAGGAEVF